MRVPIGYDFSYEEDGILFRVYHKKNKIKVTAKYGSRMVIEFGNNPYEAAEKAKRRLKTPSC